MTKYVQNKEIVPPELYNEQYYLGQDGCEGVEIFLATKGQQLTPRLQKVLDEITDFEGKTILELGCGRGELALHLEDKAKYMLCVDYSKDACNIAKQILKKAKVVCADACIFMPTLMEPFDVILMNDFIEHLYPWQLTIVYEHVNRLIKTGGMLYINTPIIPYTPKSTMHVNIQPSVGYIRYYIPDFDLLKHIVTNSVESDHLLVFQRR